MRLILFLVILWVAGIAQAQDSVLRTLNTGEDSRGWSAVGRLDIDQGGFCTAALITETLILTAAHCVYDADGTKIASQRFTFLAGLRDGRAAAARGVIQVTPHPDYIHRGLRAQNDAVTVDLALLELEQPVRLPSLAPYPIGTVPTRSASVAVVSYARDRANAPSLQRACDVLDQQGGIVMMTCAADFGASGAPVFTIADGVPRIVAVVSATASAQGTPVSLAAGIAGTLDAVIVAHRSSASQTPVIDDTPRFTSSGARNDIGAKFVRP